MQLLTDLPESILTESRVAIDTETTGLNIHSDRPVLLQAWASDSAYIVRLTDRLPDVIGRLLRAESIQKVLHYGLFDLSLLRASYDVAAVNIFDTYLAARVLEPDMISHSYAHLCDQFLGIHIDKTEQLSDWTKDLTEAQIEYAVRDVKYLLPLADKLTKSLAETKRLATAERAMHKLPIAVELKVDGVLEFYGRRGR